MSSLQDKVIVVTGGSRGIGEAIVRHCAAAGAKVHFTYRSSSANADTIVANLAAKNLSAVSHKCDVASPDDVQALIETVVKAEGAIHGLVNNAGITRDGLVMRMKDEDWDAVIDTNLKSAFTASRAVARPMMKQRNGRIVNIGSIVGQTGNAGQVNYSASKAGLIGLTKSLAKELASRNILVNCVAPGYVATDMTDKLTEEQTQAFEKNIPMQRSATPEEVATVVAFFLSDASGYVTGQVLNVDGGLAA